MRIYIKPNTREAFASGEKPIEGKIPRKKAIFAPPKDVDIRVDMKYNTEVDEEFEELERVYGPEEGP